MGTSCILRISQKQGLALHLALLLGTVTCIMAVSGSLLQGEVGGNVTVHCPVDKKKTVELFYFQHGDTYINGFHSTKHSQMPKPWNYTKVNRSEMTVHMSRLNLSHTGRYNCIISYTDGSISEEEIQLNVSANYSEPTVTTNCDEENLRCFVTCASHGGYPESKMRMNIPVFEISRNKMWKEVHSSQDQNSSTMLYSSSSTAVFNCSAGEWTNLSCSVGNVASKMFSICQAKVPSKPDWPNTAVIAGGVLGSITIMVLVFLYCYWKKNKQTATLGDNIREDAVL